MKESHTQEEIGIEPTLELEPEGVQTHLNHIGEDIEILKLE